MDRARDRAATGEDHTICTEHNKLRAKHGTQALTWSTDLAKFAQDWVNQCKTSLPDANGNTFFCHKSNCGGGNPNGENLSFHYGDPQPPENVVQGWYCEIDAYDFNDPKLTGGTMFGCKPEENPNKVTGHFTQVVWADSARLGCAKNTCSLGGNTGPLWACEYSPPGNFNANQPGVLARNVPRPRQGLVAGHTLAATGVLSQRTTAIISDVDLYDVPGGVGRVMGILRQGQKYPLVGCRDDNWCQLSVGWVWGSFVMRSHNR